MFKSIKKYLVLLILIITATLSCVGYSAFVLSEKVSKEGAQSGLTTSSPTVTIKYETEKITTVSNKVSYNTSGNSSDSKNNYNEVYGIIGQTVGSAGRFGLESSGLYDEIVSTEKITDSSTGVTTWTVTQYYFTAVCSYVGTIFIQYITIGYINTTNYTHSSTIDTDSDGNQIVYNKYVLKSGDTLKKPVLTRNGFAFIDFYKSNSDGTSSSDELFDFDTPITSNTTIFAKWTELKNDDGSAISSTKFADYVNNLSGTGNVYNGSSGYDISSDPTYSLDSKTISLTSATIGSGVTMNLCMNNGLTNVDATDGFKITDTSNSIQTNDKYVSLDYTNTTNTANTRDYTVVLQGDLTISSSAELVIGGWTGSTVGGNPENGYIIKNYVSLDLNGHNINVANGGTLRSFGLIKDSKGTGRINVEPGGYLFTQLVILDLNGGNNTLWSYAKNFAPFNNYSLPYIQCKIRLNATNSNSANLVVFSKLNLGNLGFTNVYLPFIGYSNHDDATYSYGAYLFNYKAKESTGYIDYEYDGIEELTSLYPSSYEEKNLMFYKNVFNFNSIEGNIDSANINGTISVMYNGSSVVDKDVTLKMDRVNFPISSLFNMYFINSNFTINQRLILQPGTIFELDINSNLNFNYNENKEERTFDSESINAGITTKSLPGTTKYISGGIVALNCVPTSCNPLSNIVNFYNSSSSYYAYYWKYFNSAVCNIYGNINFNTGNTIIPYTLAGKININTFSINDGENYLWNKTNLDNNLSSVYIETYAIEYNISNSFWFGSDNLLFSYNNDDSYLNANYIYALPLVSKGDAYLYGDNYSVIGTYDESTGIINGNDNNNYILLTSDKIVEADYSSVTTSTYTIQESDVSYEIIPSQCTIDGYYSVIGSQYYIFYGGNMFKSERTDETNCTSTLIKFSTEIENANYATYLKDVSMTYDGTKWVRE